MNREALGFPSPPEPGRTVTCTICRQGVAKVSYCDQDGGCGKPYCYDPDPAKGCGGASLALGQNDREWCYRCDPNLPPEAREDLVRVCLDVAGRQNEVKRRIRARLKGIWNTSPRLAAPGDDHIGADDDARVL